MAGSGLAVTVLRLDFGRPAECRDTEERVRSRALGLLLCGAGFDDCREEECVSCISTDLSITWRVPLAA